MSSITTEQVTALVNLAKTGHQCPRCHSGIFYFNADYGNYYCNECKLGQGQQFYIRNKLADALESLQAERVKLAEKLVEAEKALNPNALIHSLVTFKDSHGEALIHGDDTHRAWLWSAIGEWAHKYTRIALAKLKE